MCTKEQKKCSNIFCIILSTMNLVSVNASIFTNSLCCGHISVWSGNMSILKSVDSLHKCCAMCICLPFVCYKICDVNFCAIPSNIGTNLSLYTFIKKYIQKWLLLLLRGIDVPHFTFIYVISEKKCTSLLHR
uniref:Putative secreted protein ovary overexpressed n=1 Tax=Rhipicephalus microplus TaxID=6941 RepID=A0A6M2D951_RHIMP